MAHLLASNRETSSTGVAVKPLESDQINCQNTDDSTSIGTRSFVDPTSKEKGKINASLFHIGDLTDIEKEKENILPVRSGRSVYELVRQFSTPDKKRHSKLQEEREGFETLLTNAHEWDDPLEAYYKFVHWTIDNYPQGNNSESNLVPLLERCTRTFRTDKRYVNDPRYLRCWLMYAEYIAEPRIIFQHLEANGIGQELAAFYEEYAVNLEKESRWQQADAIYKLGINRFAQPLNRLTRKYNAFQVRMAAAGVKLSPTDLVAEQSVAEVSKKPTVERPPMRVFGNAQANTQSNVEVKDALGQHNQRLEVYQDKEDANLPAVANNNTTPWTDLGTEASRHKENRLEPTRWRGQKLSNFGTRLAQPCKKFKVYEDEPEESVEDTTPARNKTSSRLTPYSARSETDLLRDDPLHYIKLADASADKTAVDAVQKPKTKTKAPRPEVMVATFEFVYPDGVERSFEEARAAALGLLGANFDTPRTKTKPDELESPSPVKRRRRSYERPSSPTIHTKAALNDVMEMFNQPLAYENSDPDHSFDGNNEVEEKECGDKSNKEEKEDGDDKESNQTFELPSNPSKFSVYCDEDDEATSVQPSVNHLSLNYDDITDHSGHYSEDEAPEDLTRQLDLMREYQPFNTTLPLSSDDDFTINFTHRETICSTPHGAHITHTENSDDDEEKDEEDNNVDVPYTPRMDIGHRPQVMRIPVLTPITEVSERSIYYTSGHRSEQVSTGHLTALSEQSEDASTPPDTLEAVSPLPLSLPSPHDNEVNSHE